MQILAINGWGLIQPGHQTWIRKSKVYKIKMPLLIFSIIPQFSVD